MQEFTVWLEPAELSQKNLSRIIVDLAEQEKVIAFAPHITVYSGKISDMDFLQENLNDIAAHTNPIELTVDAVKATDFFFKTVFLTFKHDEPVFALNQAIAQIPHENMGYQLKPHLSLLYKDMPVEQKQQIADAIKLSSPNILFDVLSIVIPGDGKGWEDIAAWKRVYATTL